MFTLYAFNRWFHRCLLSLLFMPAVLVSAQSSASRPRTGPVPGWVQPIAVDTAAAPDESELSGGAYLRLYEQQQNLITGSLYRRVIRQILSETGVQQNSQISVDYAPSYQQLTFHTIRILRGTTVINQLNLSGIKVLHTESDLERFLYTGIYTAYLALKDIRPGDRIEYAYSVEGRNPVMKGYSGGFLYFNATNPMGQVYVSLLTDQAHPLVWRSFNGIPAPGVSSWQGKSLYSWRFAHRPPYEGMVDAPSWYDGAPCVQFSTIGSWTALADWATADFGSVRPRSAAALDKLVAAWHAEAKKDTLKFVRQATRFVQDQIRYLGVEMGPYSHRPHAPDQVLEQRYGDCKDKALLLCTLLRKGGVPAWVALVNTAYGSHLSDYVPAANLFDHAIVTFTWHDASYWIDPTMAYQRGPVTESATPDYGSALVVRAGEDGLTPMQVPGPGSVDIVESFRVPQDNTDSAALKVISIYDGGEADGIRSQFKERSLRDIQKSYLDYYKGIYKQVSRADTLKFSDDPTHNRIITVERYWLKEPWQTPDSTRKQQYFYAYAKTVQNRLPSSAEEDRKAPVALRGPLNLHYRMQVITPHQWGLDIPDDHITRSAYRYSYQPSASGDTINIDYTYNTFKDYVSPDSVKLLNADLKQMDEDLTLRLSGNGAGTGNGKQVSWFSILLSLVSGAIFVSFAIKYYRRPSQATVMPGEARPLGGWLLLLGLGIVLTPFRLLYGLITGSFYTTAIWAAAGLLHDPTLAVLIVGCIVANIFLIVCTVFQCILYFKRRDIFPKVYIFVICFDLVLLIIDNVVAGRYAGGGSGADFSGVGGVLLTALIWIPYLLISERVRHTFVFPAKEVPGDQALEVSGHPDSEPLQEEITTLDRPEIMEQEDPLSSPDPLKETD